jgi:hypothetical protein
MLTADLCFGFRSRYSYLAVGRYRPRAAGRRGQQGWNRIAMARWRMERKGLERR